MKLHGLLVVQNESDVIRDVLDFLQKLRVFETILFFDLGSSDDTFEKALDFQNILYNPRKIQQPYTEKLRFDLLEEHAHLYSDGDWLAMVDADEFYIDNPVMFIEQAEKESATYIQTYQVDFQFTDYDLKHLKDEDTSKPIYERRNFYLVNWSEERFFKYMPDGGFIFNRSKPFSRRLLNRHYQYRSPSQIQTRIQTRLENKRKTRSAQGRQEWQHIFSGDWNDYVVRHQLLFQRTDEDIQFGIPEGARWKDYYSPSPFSTLLPQIALALQQQKRIEEDGGAHSCRPKIEAPLPAGKVTFKNRYFSQVGKDLWKDTAAFQGKQALSGFLVLCKYSIRLMSRSIRLRGATIGIKTKTFLWNAAAIAKRLISGKSIGIITARPNPIPLTDYSGVGISTIKWKSIGAKKVEVRVNHPQGEIFDESGPSGEKSTGEWICDDMVFYLQDVSQQMSPDQSNTLSKVIVKLTKGNRITI